MPSLGLEREGTKLFLMPWIFFGSLGILGDFLGFLGIFEFFLGFLGILGDFLTPENGDLLRDHLDQTSPFGPNFAPW